MKQHFQPYYRSRSMTVLLMSALMLSLALSLMLIVGSNRRPVQAQGPGGPHQVWLPLILKGPPKDPLAGLGPFEAPSAFGEMYLLRRAGLLLEPEPVPGRSSRVPGTVGRGAPSRQPGVDVIVNNPGDDTPESTTQSETALAVLGNTICAGYNNSGPGGLSGLSRSPDLGVTWTDLGGIGQSGDPVLAVHEASGNFYYAEIATISGQPAIGIARSTTDCQSFGAPVDASPVASGLASTTLNDKPWIAVDNTGGARDGNIYACWTRFIDTDNDGASDTSELRFSRSIDGGLTYQNEQILQATGPAPFGCSVGVGPGGEVYVAWAERIGATAGDIRFRRSTDGGLNFNPTVTISTGNRHPGIDSIVNCPTNANPAATRPTLNGNIRMLHQVWLAVDTTGGPFNGNIYVVWASDPVGLPDNSDAFFSRSTNGGGLWSAPVQLGGGGATDQFEPFVAVGGAGAVSIAWYDRRNDVANNFNIDVYKIFSQDGGATLDPIIRVTDVSFPVPPINPNFDPGIANCYLGEYIAITADAHNFYYAWGDNRNTLVTVNFPAGRPDPDVFFDAQEAPVVNEADLRITKSDNPDPVIAGEQLAYDISVFNDGPDIALDVIVTDILPPGVTYVTDTGACDTSALPTLTCSLGDMLSGDVRQLSILVDVDSDLVVNVGGPTMITNEASVTGVGMDPAPLNNTVSADTLVVAEADMSIAKTDSLDPAIAGENLTYTIEVTNDGPSDAADVIVVDILPAEVTYVSDTDGCTEAPAGTLTCNLGDLGVGGTVQFDVTVAVAPDVVFNAGGPTTITNAAEVSSVTTDPNPDNNNASEDTLVIAVADLEIVSFEAVDAPAEVLVGQDVEITLRKLITNNGPSGPMDVELTKMATAPADSTVTPAGSTIQEPALGLGELREVLETFTINCGQASHHLFTFSNEIQPLHPEDTDPDQSNNTAFLELDIECVVPVIIEVKPKQITLNGEGVVPVTVLTTAAGEYGLPLPFDASTIDPLSVRFGPQDVVWFETGGAAESHNRGHGTGTGMMFHFIATETGLATGDTQACLKGTWLDEAGNPHKFLGCDEVVVK